MGRGGGAGYIRPCIVIPTEGPLGPSGGIYVKSRSALAHFPIDSSARSLRSLGRNDSQTQTGEEPTRAQ